MKKIILTLTAILLWFQTSAQDKNEINPDSQFTFCEIVGSPKNMASGKSVIRIVFGESNQIYLDDRKNQAKSYGIVCTSMVDALNFMTKKGWDFVQAYSTSDATLGFEYHYLLKKKTSLLKPEEISSTK